MNVTEMQIGLDVLIGILSAAAGALTIWYTLKNKVQIQQLLIDQSTQDIVEIKSNSKNACDMLHKRVDGLKTTVERNREKNDGAISELKTEMGQMELRIIQAIHGLNK